MGSKGERKREMEEERMNMKGEYMIDYSDEA